MYLYNPIQSINMYIAYPLMEKDISLGYFVAPELVVRTPEI